MKRKFFYTFLGALLSLVCQAQTDTVSYDTSEVYINKNFSTYSSSLQFSIGQNLTVGSYGAGKRPFSDGFASGDLPYRKINVNAKYTKLIKHNYGFEIGAEFIRNSFDNKRFADNHLEATGDTFVVNGFLYQHLSLYFGANYNFSYKRLMVSFNTGTGFLYNVPISKQIEVVLPIVENSRTSSSSAVMSIKRSIAPMFYTGLNLKLYLGDEFYLVANSQFTYSLLKIDVKERVSHREQRDYLDKSISVNNISLSLGVGTLF